MFHIDNRIFIISLHPSKKLRSKQRNEDSSVSEFTDRRGVLHLRGCNGGAISRDRDSEFTVAQSHVRVPTLYNRSSVRPGHNTVVSGIVKKRAKYNPAYITLNRRGMKNSAPLITVINQYDVKRHI